MARTLAATVLIICIFQSCWVTPFGNEDNRDWIASTRGRLQSLKTPVKKLRAKDFADGTYRITKSGKYVLQEDIEFSPKPENDFWPTFGDQQYPMGNYFLGFFAAITVETSNVWIDLNGKTIQQSKEFYLKQRFFNVIELADRVFEPNEGVFSMNLQPNDKFQFNETGTVGPRKSASSVLISNGVLGRSSHNGIHCNGCNRIVVDRVKVVDFEVTGIQFNGVNQVAVLNCQVGPSSTQVPVTSKFSNMRFLNFYTRKVIPWGFPREGPIYPPLLQEEIMFADRPGQAFTIQDVFDRLDRALSLFISWKLDKPLSGLSATDQSLLDSAIALAHNEVHLPDGSVLYGIIIHRTGAATQQFGLQDENLEDDMGSRDIVLRDVVISGLKMQVKEVPTLVMADGTIMQGPVRDSLDLSSMTTNTLYGPSTATYSGTPLSDAYFAFWQLSNSFYKLRAWGSTCGNFGSNATSNWASCAPLIRRDITLTGRASTMLQKKYFGGLAISQAMYDWATTPGATLSKLLETPADIKAVRQSHHHILCGSDVMFHVTKGVVGLRIEFVHGATINNLEVSDLTNLGDDSRFVCKQKWQLLNKERIRPKRLASGMAMNGDVRGIRGHHSSDIVFNQVSVSNLMSDEGWAFGIEMHKEHNDLTDYNVSTAPGSITYTDVAVAGLTAGQGGQAIPYWSSYYSTPSGIVVDQEPPLHNNFKHDKATMMMHIMGARPRIGSTLNYTTGLEVAAGAFSIAPFDFDIFKRVPGLETTSAQHAFRTRCLGHFKDMFGLTINVDDATPLDAFVPVGTNSSMVLTSVGLEENAPYQFVTYCDQESCTKPNSESQIVDIFYAIFAGPQGEMAYGEWGGPHGKYLYPGQFLVCGAYGVENSGLFPDGRTITVRYFSQCPGGIDPLDGIPGYTPPAGIYVGNCALESDIFGRGSAIISILFQGVGTKVFSGTTNMWSFDDQDAFNQLVPRAAAAAAPKDLGRKWYIHDHTIRLEMDGTIELPLPMAGVDAFPATRSYHFVNEAGVKCMAKWTSYNTEEKMLALRRRFLEFVRDKFGVAEVGANLSFWDAYDVNSLLDLGRQLTVQPYAVNDDVNTRASQYHSITSAQLLPIDARVHDCGFRLIAGRAGVNTSVGFQTMNTYLVMGEMVIENAYVAPDDAGKTQPLRLQFQSMYPVLPSTLSMSLDAREVHHDVWGKGLYKMVHLPIYDDMKQVYMQQASGGIYWGAEALPS